MRILGFVAIVCLAFVVLVSATIGAVLVVITHVDPEDDTVPGCSP